MAKLGLLEGLITVLHLPQMVTAWRTALPRFRLDLPSLFFCCLDFASSILASLRPLTYIVWDVPVM